MKSFRLPMTGGCLCARHRYQIDQPPLTLYACHCTDCQTQSTSAFGLSMPVPRAAVSGTLEGLGHHVRHTAAGRTVTGWFCAACGTRLFNEPSRNPLILNIKPGTLDDTAWLRPVGHLWLADAQPWFQPPADALCYAGQPDGFDALFERFGAVRGAAG